MNNKSFIISIIILSLTIIGAAVISSRELPQVVQTNLENLPMHIGSYTATTDSFSKAVYDELNADRHVYRHYRSPTGLVIDLYIGYYGTAKGGRTGHNPYACLPGAGWGIVKDFKVTLEPRGYGQPVEVNGLISQKEGYYNVILHWYQTRGDIILDSGIEQNIQRFIGSIVYNRNDGAFVRVSIRTNQQGISKAKMKLKSFAEKLLPLLPKYWPREE